MVISILMDMKEAGEAKCSERYVNLERRKAQLILRETERWSSNQETKEKGRKCPQEPGSMVNNNIILMDQQVAVHTYLSSLLHTLEELEDIEILMLIQKLPTEQ